MDWKYLEVQLYVDDQSWLNRSKLKNRWRSWGRWGAFQEEKRETLHKVPMFEQRRRGHCGRERVKSRWDQSSRRFWRALWALMRTFIFLCRAVKWSGVFEKENWLWHWEQTIREWGQKQNDPLGGDFSDIYERCGGSDHGGGRRVVRSDTSLEIIRGEANGISFQIMRYERKIWEKEWIWRRH